MRIGCIGRTELRLHPLLLAVFAAACILGKVSALLQAMLAVIVHELSHAVVSYAFCVRVYALELLPFGAVARMDRQTMRGDAELCIAAAGPLASLLVAGLTATFTGLFPSFSLHTDAFLTYNLVLAAVNLLPALPLDGGRILRALLQRKLPVRSVTIVASVLGLAFGAGFLALAAICTIRGIYNLTVPTMGVFLLLAAWRELRLLPETTVQAHYRRLDALHRGELCRVAYYAAPASMRACDALRLLRRDCLYVLRIMDAEMRCIGELDEAKLMEGIAALGAQRELRDVLLFDRCKGV